MLSALTNVLDDLAQLQPAGAYRAAYGTFKASAERVVQSLQEADLNDSGTWMHIEQQLALLASLCRTLPYVTRMPGLFRCLHDAIESSLNNQWALIPPSDREQHLVELLHAIGSGFLQLHGEEYERTLGPGSADVMHRIGVHLQNA